MIFLNYEIYGDSILAGFRLRGKSYAEKLFYPDVKNYSFCGATVFDMLEIAYTQTQKSKSIALIGCGINDLIVGRKVDIISEKISETASRLIFLEKSVYVQEILPVKKNYFLALEDFSEDEINEKIDSLNMMLLENSSKYNYTFIQYGLKKDELSTFDGVHPDESGNLLLYNKLKYFMNNFS